ncbi:MAG: RDD family protein [Dokdonella sp.]
MTLTAVTAHATSMPLPTPASLWLRLAAAVYDLFPLIALWMLTAGLCLLAVGGHVDLAHPPLGWRIALRVALLAVTAGYFVISWSRGGQTIGMRAWRLRVVTTAGAALPWSRALARFGAALISLLAGGLGLLWCLFERDRRGWHDLLVGTRVMRLPK